MHQPVAAADEEGVGLVNREVVHGLCINEVVDGSRRM